MKDDTLNGRNGVGIMENGDYDDIVRKVQRCMAFWRRSWSTAAPLGRGSLLCHGNRET